MRQVRHNKTTVLHPVPTFHVLVWYAGEATEVLRSNVREVAEARAEGYEEYYRVLVIYSEGNFSREEIEAVVNA